MEEIRRCRKCGARLLEHEKRCPVCGIEVLENTGEVSNEETLESSIDDKIEPLMEEPVETVYQQNYWKNKWIWLTVVILIVVTTFMKESLIASPIKLAENDSKITDSEITVSKNTNDFSQATNINNLGISYVNNGSVYLVMGGELLKYDSNFNNRELVLDEAVTAFSQDENGYYYLDNNNNYIFTDKETKKEDVLLKKAYYVHKLGDQIYYQNDPDGETIHCLQLKSNEDHKINDEVSYNIMVDEQRKRIFYTNDSKELVSIALDGSDEKRLASNTSIYTYDGEYLYYINDEGLVKTDLDGESSLIYESSNLSLVNIVGKKLIVQDKNIIYKMDLNGKNKKELYTMDIGGSITFEVVGDKLVVLTKGSGDMSVGYEIVGLDGKRHIIDSGDHPAIKGNEF